MKILLNDLKIKNPYREESEFLHEEIGHIAFEEGQQSILSQLKEVDIDALMARWCGLYCDVIPSERPTFSQFLKEYVNEDTNS